MDLLAQAEAYVRTRFYPPLPVEYGALAVEAVERVNTWDDEPLDVTGLDPLPRAAYVMDERVYVQPTDLVDALRLHHLID